MAAVLRLGMVFGRFPNDRDVFSDVFSNVVGFDVYYNPWWGLNTASPDAQALAVELNRILGEPSLQFNGIFHRLEWGPLDLPYRWRIGFHVNESYAADTPEARRYGRGSIWRTFWLPWAGVLDNLEPYNCATQSGGDITAVARYAAFIPMLRTALECDRSLLHLMINTL